MKDATSTFMRLYRATAIEDPTKRREHAQNVCDVVMRRRAYYEHTRRLRAARSGVTDPAFQEQEPAGPRGVAA